MEFITAPHFKMMIPNEDILNGCRKAIQQAELTNEDFSSCCMWHSMLTSALLLYTHEKDADEETQLKNEIYKLVAKILLKCIL